MTALGNAQLLPEIKVLSILVFRSHAFVTQNSFKCGTSTSMTWTALTTYLAKSIFL